MVIDKQEILNIRPEKQNSNHLITLLVTTVNKIQKQLDEKVCSLHLKYTCNRASLYVVCICVFVFILEAAQTTLYFASNLAP